MATLVRLVLSLAAALALTGHPTPVSNRAAARHDANRLLGLVVLPTGARRLSSPPGGGLGGGPFQVLAGARTVNRYRFWRVRESLDSVVAFVRAHRPHGSERNGSGIQTGGGPRTPPNETVFFAFGAQTGRTSFRWLGITIVALRDGSTGVEADAQEVWIVPRPATEVVPAGVREVDVVTSRRSVRVTRPRTVTKIVRWLDHLPTVQPGILSCPAFVPPGNLTLEFRGARGHVLALARSSYVSSPCYPVHFRIGGRRQKPLLGGLVLLRVERLLGTRLR